ncbi:NAD(P)-dependent alcohol dehydrogenase [Algoriphagus halophytocola]|uniref:NAD(P)-dependent alcohol dehydrogenase n=1 Tax=Algoriphagus halophytocola TaxID=2991499 RepID=A0ABY6MLN9_9BACT|nr:MULTISPECIES: NAD(P)-dependent alcohol dehydrogenase [unclassified Algoriphagus]UZD23201.1 NAD(P)-dependent alcohol dehydrogenase [Algoriphagus sp. TR-M5]WBL44494.1 NAD(P)-dependent alcohol dehydrogenase [Algoriphagus sp. TR-M9]
MKAAIRTQYGTPDVIEIREMPVPTPKANQLLIKVHATTVNRTDCANLTAKPFIMRFLLGLFSPKKIRIGTDFAGEVVSVGEKVSSFTTGDRVFGFNDMGYESQSEFLTVPEDGNVFPIPENISYTTAAAGLEGAHYAYTFIHKVKFTPGQHVLINGASGAIGSALLQMLKPFEVKITATCNTKNLGLIRSLGADKVVDYTQTDFTQDQVQYDYVFDAVGKSTLGKCKAILKGNGTYISSELGPYSQNIFYALFTPFIGKNKVIFPVPYPIKTTVPYISELLEKGIFKPIIDTEYQLEDIAKAYEFALTGQKTGNLLIRLS